MSDFVHLHVHTQYSLLDGFSHISKLVKRAKELEMPALGITDHGTLFGVIDFFKAAQAEGIKPIIGIEAYMAKRGMTEKNSKLDRTSSHLLLLAENQTGYQNLLKIASAAQLEGFYYYPRIDHEFLAAHAEGLIATSGCMSAEVPRALRQDNPDEARRMLDWYYDVFGPDNFFVELQNHDIPELPGLNKQLIELGTRYQANYVATNDVHYIRKDDARLQDIMLCVQTGSLVNDPKRMRMSDDSYYLKDAKEMATLFADVPGALSNSLAIAERCNVDLSSDGYKLPAFEVPEGHTDKSYLRELCEAGLRKRYGPRAGDEDIRERLEYELGIIDEMGFNAYFLIVWDLCRYSQEEGIWYNARGSAAGSIVAYTLEITLVDPLEHGLIFERFLNPGRVSMPDIDLDFQDDLRYKIMEYCARRYGDDKVAAIITFGKLKARAAVRDVGRVLDIPLSEVDRIAKMIPSMPLNTTIEEAIQQVPDLNKEYASNSWARELLDTAKEIEGSIRNAGTHAAGVVVTDKPVVEYIPLHRPTSNAEDTPIKTVTQFEMSTIDALGLLKVDFLGLSTLTIMQRCCAMIQDRHGVELNLDNIPLDDPETFAMLGRGDTAGIFQLEGSGMTRWVMEMKPTTLSHVIAMVALYRPGPMEYIPSFVKRMHGVEEVSYRHEKQVPILEETYGITVYQEQIMYTAMDLAGYTASEADFLRKAVAKKKAKDLFENREKFINGAVERGVPDEAAAKIFEDWEAFARYGFPKGHAADYAVIAVETAYLKTHYPVEYMTALLSVHKDNTDKVAYYVADCRNNLGIEVLPPDISRSEWDFSIEDDEDGTANIRFGMGAVKNVGVGPVDAILEGREEGLFEDITDLANRVDLRKVGKRAFESLIKAGALDGFGPRMALLNVMERTVSISSSQFQAADAGQMSFFGSDSDLVQKIKLPDVDPTYNRREQLNWERELVGLYVSEHPLSSMAENLKDKVSHFSSQLSQVTHHQKVRVFGEVTTIRHHQTRKGDPMAFVNLEDPQGVIRLVIFPRTWKRGRELVQYGKVLLIEGKADTEKGDANILVDKIHDLEKDATSLNLPKMKKPELPQVPPLVKKADPKKHQPAAPEEEVETISEPAADYTPSGDEGPPPPENFPEDWESQWVDEHFEVSVEHQLSEPEIDGGGETVGVEKTERSQESVSRLEEPVLADSAKEEEVVGKSAPTSPAQNSAEVGLGIPQQEEKPNLVPILPKIPKAAFTEPAGGQKATRMVTIILRSTGDKARDILRMRRVYGMVISYPGNDRFAFYVIERNRGYRLEFPNDTTILNDELRARLDDLLGPENILLEPITYQ